jgi:hypothetical protein
MDNEKLIQEFIKQFTGQQRVEVESFLKDLVQNGVRFKDAVKETNKEFTSTGITIRDVAGSVNATLKALTSTRSEVNEGVKSFKKLSSIVSRIQDDQAGIYELSLKELKANKVKASSELRRLKDISRGLKERFDRNEELTDKELELLSAYEEEFQNEKALVSILDERIQKTQSLESALGLTGAVLDNLNKIGIRALGGIGVNLGTLQEAFDEAREAGKNAAKDIEDLNDSEQFSDLSKRIYTLGASLEGIGKGIFEAFNDPLSLGLGLFKTISSQVNALNKAQNDFRRLAGESAQAIGQINSRAVTAVDLLNTMSSITEQIGLQANLIFSSSQLVNIAKAQELLGLSAEQATNLGIISKLTNQTQESFNNSLLKGADAANTLFKSAVPPGVALREAANASADIVLSLGMAPGRLGSAATAAKALGLELSKIDSIADSLLDFESSISSELEAQLFIGREINLNRAREFALVNDLEGVARELAANTVTAAEFANMNRLAQDALAKSLGLSRKELGEVVLQQELANSLTDSQRARVLGVNQAQLEQLDIQKSIEKSIQSITQSLAGPLEFFANILEKTGAIQAIIGGAFAVSIGKFTLGIISALAQFKAAKAQADLLTASLLKAAGASQAIKIPAPGSISTGGAGFTKAPFALGRAGAGRGLLAGAGRVGAGALGVLGGPAGLAVLGAALAGGLLLKSLTKEGDDVISKPKSGYGDRVLLEKGSITPLYNGDTVFAASNSPTQMQTNNGRTDQLLEALLAEVRKGGNVYIDGNKAGEALVMGSYKV